jgi:hypothetical protein
LAQRQKNVTIITKMVLYWLMTKSIY